MSKQTMGSDIRKASRLFQLVVAGVASVVILIAVIVILSKVL